MKSSRSTRWLIYAVSVAVTGLVGALAWVAAVAPPEYDIGADGAAWISEKSLSQLFAMDVWFTFTGLIAGIVLGTLAWALFREVGWPVVVIAMLGGIVAALLCWQFGSVMGSSDFDARVIAAKPDERVPVDFTLHARSALLVWPGATLLPIILYSFFDRGTDRGSATVTQAR
ncbi:MAG: hypothetical protein LBM94_02885 [Propionibacteriaceae bacterium]|jgi:hypothetical protein|nr:hypothetical protein [Propionibacteriaceae bacterium]